MVTINKTIKETINTINNRAINNTFITNMTNKMTTAITNPITNKRGTLPLRELMITIVVIAAIILFIIAVTKVLTIFN